MASTRVTRRNYASVDVTIDQITPLYDNLLVRRIYDAHEGLVLDVAMKQTKNGDWVDADDHGPRKGVVVRVGPGDKRPPSVYLNDRTWYDGSWRMPMDVEVGDTIIYPRFESSHVMIGGKQYTFVREGDVMGVIEDD